MSTVITLSDLQKAEGEGHGFGISTRRDLSDALSALVGDFVVHQANEIGLSYDDFALWVDSKLGRWLVDEASSFEGQNTVEWPRLAELVEKYLNDEKVASLRAEDL